MTQELKLRRINIMLDEDSLKVLDDFAMIMNISRSAMVRSLMQQAKPQLEQLNQTLQDYKDLTPQEQAQFIARAEHGANKLTDNAQKTIDFIGG